MIDYSLIGKKIREARTIKNLTQVELAKELGVSTGYICQIENGEKCFNLSRLEAVAKIFNKPVTYFLEGAAGEFRMSAISEIVAILSKLDENELEKAKEMLKIIAK